VNYDGHAGSHQVIRGTRDVRVSHLGADWCPVTSSRLVYFAALAACFAAFFAFFSLAESLGLLVFAFLI